MFDRDDFEQTAAWLEFCDGMTRFAAETEAAKRQGVKRHDIIRNLPKARDHGSQLQRHSEVSVSRVQPHQTQQARQVPVGDVHAGGRSVEMSPLLQSGRRVL